MEKKNSSLEHPSTANTSFSDASSWTKDLQAANNESSMSLIFSSNGADSSIPNSGFVMKLAVVASMSGLLFGYDTGVVSGCIIFLRGYMQLSDLQVEIVVASTILSAAISAALGHHLLDHYGRKATLMVASCVFVIGSLIMACAIGGGNHGYSMLVMGRIVVGGAIGLASDAGPLYISECAPQKLRGSLTTLFNVAVVGGQVFASIVCGCLSYLPPTYNWRWMMALGAVPALMQMAGFMMLPLSPTWLVFQGRTEEAEAVLRKIRAAPSTDDTENDEVVQELNDIIEENEMAKKGKHVHLLDLWLKNPPIRRAMLLGCSLWAVSQLAGINTIMYYGASIVRRTGIEGGKSFDIWITVPLNTMQLIGICVCYAIIDKKGRRSTLLTSMLFVGIGLFLIGLGFAMDSPITTVFAMCLYLFAFGVGLSTMPYTMNSEIYPSEYRGLCVSQATGVFWFTNFLVSVTFLTLAHLLTNAGVFFLYAGIVAISGIAFYRYVPETSGLSLHQIQGLFEGVPAADNKPLSPTNNGYGATSSVLVANSGVEIV